MSAISWGPVVFAGVATWLHSSLPLEETPNCSIILRTSTKGHLDTGSTRYCNHRDGMRSVSTWIEPWCCSNYCSSWATPTPTSLASWPMFIIPLVSCHATSFMLRRTHGMLIPLGHLKRKGLDNIKGFPNYLHAALGIKKSKL